MCLFHTCVHSSVHFCYLFHLREVFIQVTFYCKKQLDPWNINNFNWCLHQSLDVLIVEPLLFISDDGACLCAKSRSFSYYIYYKSSKSQARSDPNPRLDLLVSTL